VRALTVTDLAKTEARMLRWMGIIAVLGAFTILLLGHPRTAVAFGTGVVVGVLNFHWLCKTVTVLMDAQVTRVSRKIAILMLARYPLGFAGLILMYHVGSFPLLPLIVGLLVPGAGVFLESLVLIGAGLREEPAA
jgi:hypothetical protein